MVITGSLLPGSFYVILATIHAQLYCGTMAIFLVHRKNSFLVRRFFRPCHLLLQVTAAAAVAAARAVMHILPAPASERVAAFPASFSI